MLTQRSLQSQLVQEDLKRLGQRYSPSQNKSKLKALIEKAIKYLVLFLNTSSIHGLNHLVVAGRHPFEVFLWLSIVIFSLLGTIYISRTTWVRYQSSPTVVSMDRDMFAWNTTFPSITICLDDKIDSEKLDNYIRTTSEEDKEEMKAFIQALANASFENFDIVPEYKGIAPDKYLETLLNLSVVFKPTLTIGAAGVSLQLIPTVTEMGLCYGINSKVAVYNSPEYRAANRWDMVHSDNSSFFVHPLDGEVFAQVLNISSPYNAYIHGPLEVPDVSTKHHHSLEKFYMKLYVTALTVYTAPEAAKLSVGQRRCRFPHENNLKHNSVYSYTMCRMECRVNLCLKHCNCIPHFYRRIGDEKICDVEGLKCLVNHKNVLYKLTNMNGTRVKCDCYPLCDDINYTVQLNALQEWFMGTTFQWGIVTYPRMRYRRDIIFGFTDVLVSVGGMAGLFLGCSVLSFMEIVYFLSLRLLCYARNDKK